MYFKSPQRCKGDMDTKTDVYASVKFVARLLIMSLEEYLSQQLLRMMKPLLLVKIILGMVFSPEKIVKNKIDII
jgi:hypothetical protein